MDEYIRELIAEEQGTTLYDERDTDMTITYEYTIKVKAVYPYAEKSAEEMANDCGQMVCDEVAMAGGAGCYEIIQAECK